MLIDKQKDELEIMIQFDDWFEDKNLEIADEVWKYCEYLKSLCDAAAQDYIDDNELEDE